MPCRTGFKFLTNGTRELEQRPILKNLIKNWDKLSEIYGIFLKWEDNLKILKYGFLLLTTTKYFTNVPTARLEFYTFGIAGGIRMNW